MVIWIIRSSFGLTDLEFFLFSGYKLCISNFLLFSLLFSFNPEREEREIIDKLFWNFKILRVGFSSGLNGKESACNAGDQGSIHV